MTLSHKLDGCVLQWLEGAFYDWSNCLESLQVRKNEYKTKKTAKSERKERKVIQK